MVVQLNFTPMHAACQNGHTEVVQVLLKHNASCTMRDAVCYIVEKHLEHIVSPLMLEALNLFD